MTHPDNDRKLERKKENRKIPASAQKIAFEKWIDAELVKLEEKYDAYKTVNSLRLYFQR